MSTKWYSAVKWEAELIAGQSLVRVQATYKDEALRIFVPPHPRVVETAVSALTRELSTIRRMEQRAEYAAKH